VPPIPLLATLAVVPARFAPHAGWHAGHERPHACVGVTASRCVTAASWASTIRWRDCGWCLPHETIAALPPDGIALQISTTRERPLVARTTTGWPPRIAPRDVVAGFEGVPARYGVFQRFARFRGVEVYVWGWFGRAQPTRAQLSAANTELARLSTPR
jgi:hypothetical protein